jgi:hypothetical protein
VLGFPRGILGTIAALRGRPAAYAEDDANAAFDPHAAPEASRGV